MEKLVGAFARYLTLAIALSACGGGASSDEEATLAHLDATQSLELVSRVLFDSSSSNPNARVLEQLQTFACDKFGERQTKTTVSIDDRYLSADFREQPIPFDISLAGELSNCDGFSGSLNAEGAGTYDNRDVDFSMTVDFSLSDRHHETDICMVSASNLLFDNLSGREGGNHGSVSGQVLVDCDSGKTARCLFNQTLLKDKQALGNACS